MELRPAVFLDRDGTVILDRDYPGDPDGVELLPGAAGAVARFNAAGLPVILVTNQSGIARGLITDADFRAVQGRTEALLEAEGARLDGVYHCPHGPETEPPCDCRKPAPGMYRRAAAERGLDLARSFYVGDRLRDVLPGLDAGGTGILIQGPGGAEFESAVPVGVQVVESLAEAAEIVLGGVSAD